MTEHRFTKGDIDAAELQVELFEMLEKTGRAADGPNGMEGFRARYQMAKDHLAKVTEALEGAERDE